MQKWNTNAQHMTELTQEGFELCKNCGHAFNAHGPWIANPGDKTCIEVEYDEEEEQDELTEEELEARWCEYHKLYHWPCF
jgi:tRNA G26 N,N-dimethylase Trm1